MDGLSTKRILLADSHGDARQIFYSALENEPGIEVVGEADTGAATLQLVRELRPDVVVMSMNMPGHGGLETTRSIIAASPDTKVLGVSLHSDSRFVVRALHAGAFGYILEECAFEELANAVRAVASNHTYVSPGIAGITKED